ncbi:ribonuclease M5 [Granulicatella balaenopterae]|uniref:Ribonuclease M5 n=1 Tax=Granulicatella balaenopterae TaxID=137733 RepID=A0A1H9NHK6_9LACT|nr:ribonuclease M5 [Granulicatella balaenopterae]SER35145.1 ribonuclease M5 [Granulicatella balaenopterae]
MIKEVIVVEGRDDTRRLTEVFGEVDTIETNGSAINQKTLELIKKANESRGVIVFTDPDYPGTRIRSIITERIPTAKHAFLPKKAAISKRTGESLGVEHASDEAIREALSKVYQVQELAEVAEEELITQTDLIRLGLIGQQESGSLRNQVTEILSIGHTNGKQLLKRLHMFGIKPIELKEAVEQAKK